MDTWKSFSIVQKIIVLIIAGIMSLVALVGLTETHEDYYVAAAISRAFFFGVLLLVVSSPILYVFRRRQDPGEHTSTLSPDSSPGEITAKPVEAGYTSKPKRKTVRISVTNIVAGTLLLATAGCAAGFLAYLRDSPSNTVAITNAEIQDSDLCATVQIENSETVKIQKPFDPNVPPDGKQFYVLSDETGPWTKTRISVDREQFPLEEILTAKTAMNHTPHIVRIVKDGFVIFEYEGAGLAVYEVDDWDGFILAETLDWNLGTTRRTRYVYEDGGFRPVWYQQNCKPVQ